MTEVIKDSNENPEKNHQAEHHRIKSFVVRAGRMTEGQVRAIEELGPKYMVDVEDLKPLDLKAIFGREAPLVVEIGFGMGVSFVQMAKDAPECNFLGIEVHPPGVGSALKLIEENQIVEFAKARAQEILDEAEQQRKELISGAVEYADRIMAEAEQSVTDTYDTLHAGISALQAKGKEDKTTALAKVKEARKALKNATKTEQKQK